MTLDQIDRMVRQANPVPDPSVLEPGETSVLHEQRRMDMQTHDWVTVDDEGGEPKRGRNLLIGIAAAAAIIVGVLLLRQPINDSVADQPAPSATELATAFVEAYGSFDVDRAAAYLAADANLFSLEGGPQGWQLGNRMLEAQGFKLLFDSCEEHHTSPSGIVVRCMFDFHGFRSDEIGLGPFSGGWFDLRIQEGEIVWAEYQLGSREFAVQMWVPFAEWVAETYPEDVAIMYLDSSQTVWRLTEESIALWEQRSREYVEAVLAEQAG